MRVGLIFRQIQWWK